MLNATAQKLGRELEEVDDLERFSRWLNQRVAWLAGGALVLMMLLSVANMFLRAAGRPFGGTAEVVGWLSALTTAWALGYTQVHRGHVAIDLLVDRLPGWVRQSTDGFISLVGSAFFVLATWRVVVRAGEIARRGSLSETMQVPFFPFIYAVAFGLACLALVLLVEGLKDLREAVKR